MGKDNISGRDSGGAEQQQPSGGSAPNNSSCGRQNPVRDDEGGCGSCQSGEVTLPTTTKCENAAAVAVHRHQEEEEEVSPELLPLSEQPRNEGSGASMISTRAAQQPAAKANDCCEDARADVVATAEIITDTVVASLDVEQGVIAALPRTCEAEAVEEDDNNVETTKSLRPEHSIISIADTNNNANPRIEEEEKGTTRTPERSLSDIKATAEAAAAPCCPSPPNRLARSRNYVGRATQPGVVSVPGVESCSTTRQVSSDGDPASNISSAQPPWGRQQQHSPNAENNNGPGVLLVNDNNTAAAAVGHAAAEPANHHRAGNTNQVEGEILVDASLVFEGRDTLRVRNEVDKRMAELMGETAVAVPAGENNNNNDNNRWCNNNNACLCKVLLIGVGIVVADLIIVVGSVFGKQRRGDGGGEGGVGGHWVSPPSPSVAPAVSSPPDAATGTQQFQSLVSTEELYLAVDDYLRDDSDDTAVANRYGHPIGSWNVSSIRDFSSVFSAERNPLAAAFDAPLSGWDVSRATTMKAMFETAVSFRQNISRWDVSQVRDASFMFFEAVNFDADLSSWDVSRVTSTRGMFENANSFRQNLCDWGPRLNNDSGSTTTGAANVVDMFAGSGCPENSKQTDLGKDPPGPFCFIC